MSHVTEMLEDYEYGSDEDAEFGGLLGSVGSFVSNAAKTCGKAVGSVGTSIQSAGGSVGNLIKKVPVVGAPMHAVMSAQYHMLTAPADIVIQSAINGKRLDKAVLNNIKQQAKDAKAVAPYAKSVVSMVPGIGTGAAAAIGAGLALAEGQPIDKALVAAVISAVPGGPLAQAAAGTAAKAIEAAATGKKFDIASVAGSVAGALPIPAAAQKALTAGVQMTADLASGKKVDAALADALIKQGLEHLPADAKKAFQTGMGIEVARLMQAQKGANLPAIHGKLLESGLQTAKALPVVAEARKLAGNGVKGFDLARGLSNQRSSLFDIMHVRSALPSHDKKGFDMALANHIGMVTHPAKKGISPAAQAGKTVVDGLQGMASARNKMAIVKTITASPSAEVGAKVAMNQIAARRKSWPVRVAETVKGWFGQRPTAKPLVSGPDAKRTLITRLPTPAKPKPGLVRRGPGTAPRIPGMPQGPVVFRR